MSLSQERMGPRDVYHGEVFPVAPLFATASIVPDEVKQEVEKVDVAAAESTLNALDKAVRSFERKGKLSISAPTKPSVLKSVLTRQGWIALCALAFMGLLISSMIHLQHSQDR